MEQSVFAVFDRLLAAYAEMATDSESAILTESTCKFSNTTARSVVIEAAMRWKIEKLIWDSWMTGVLSRKSPMHLAEAPKPGCWTTTRPT